MEVSQEEIFVNVLRNLYSILLGKDSHGDYGYESRFHIACGIILYFYVNIDKFKQESEKIYKMRYIMTDQSSNLTMKCLQLRDLIIEDRLTRLLV